MAIIGRHASRRGRAVAGGGRLPLLLRDRPRARRAPGFSIRDAMMVARARRRDALRRPVACTRSSSPGPVARRRPVSASTRLAWTRLMGVVESPRLIRSWPVRALWSRLRGRRDHRRRRPGRALSLQPSRRYRAPGVAARFRLPRRRHAPWVSPVSPLSPCGFRAGLPHAASRWADGARRCGLRPDRLPATAPLRLSSPVLRPFLARQESLVAPSSAALRPRAVRVDRLPA